jgi:hypothetical protein
LAQPGEEPSEGREFVEGMGESVVGLGLWGLALAAPGLSSGYSVGGVAAVPNCRSARTGIGHFALAA